MRSASSVDIDGVTATLLIVETSTAPIWLGSDAGLLDRLARGGLGEVDRVDALARALAGDDAGALADPLVAGVDRLDEVGVR